MDAVDTIIARGDRLEQNKQVHASVWKEIHDLIYPSGDSFGIGKTARGGKAHQKVLDGTGEQAADLFASSLYGMNTNPNQVWQRIRAHRESLNNNRNVMLWLESANRAMKAAFNSPLSRFAIAQHEKLLDLVSYGTGCGFTAESKMIGAVYQGVPLGSVSIAEDQYGQPDTVYRRIRLAARVAAQKFGAGLGGKVAEAADDPNKADDEFEFLHCVEPRTERDAAGIGARDMPFKSVYVSLEDKEIVRNGGFEEFPYSIPRMPKRSGEAYGRGPGHKALADVKMLQRSMKAQITGVELAQLPPVQVPDDGILGPIRMSQAGITRVRGDYFQFPGGGMRPVSTGARPDIGEDFLAGIRTRIDNAFYKFLLQMFGDPRMTATQVVQITDEVVRVIGPILGRLQIEDLGPMVNRTFHILLRAGAIPSLPEELEGEDLEVEYMSPMAQAQNLNEVRGYVNTWNATVPMARFAPDMFDNVDFDAAYRDIGKILGHPMSTMRDTQQRDRMREARSQVAQQEATREDLLAAADAAPNVAQLVGGLATGGGERAAV